MSQDQVWRNRKSIRTHPKHRRCYRCNKVGHWRAECPDRPTRTGTVDPQRSPCANCGYSVGEGDREARAREGVVDGLHDQPRGVETLKDAVDSCAYCGIRGHHSNVCRRKQRERPATKFGPQELPREIIRRFRALLDELDDDEVQESRRLALWMHEERHAMGIGTSSNSLVIPGGMESELDLDSEYEDSQEMEAAGASCTQQRERSGSPTQAVNPE